MTAAGIRFFVFVAGCRIERVAPVAQLVEHVLGKDEVSGSIPLVGSSFRDVRDVRIKVKLLR